MNIGESIVVGLFTFGLAFAMNLPIMNSTVCIVCIVGGILAGLNSYFNVL